MKKITLVCMTLMLVATQLMAAQKLNLKDITAGVFRPEALSEVCPLSDGESYAQISADGKQIVKYSFRSGKQTGVLFDVTTARGAKLSRVEGYVMSPTGKRILIQTDTKRIYRRSFTAQYYIYNIQNNTLEPLSEGGPQQIPVWSPDGEQVAFVRDNNIYLIKLLYGNAESQVTKDGKRNAVINGLPDWVYEEEFSTNSSVVFTADSRQIVWIRYDESAVKEYSMQMFRGGNPSYDEYADYPGFYTYKYPKAGMDNSKVSVLSYDIKSHQTRTMKLPLDADGYIPRLKATTDASKVAAFTMNRHQDVLRIYMVNPLSTECKLVIEDKVDKYIKEDVLSDTKLTSSHIVLTSERDGWNHIYLYTLNGQLLRRVTSGKFAVTTLYGYDEATGDTYYAANSNGPTDQRVFVTHANGKTECLSQRAGINKAIFSTDYKFFINQWSDMNTPSVYTLCTNKNKELASLIDNKELKTKLSAYELGTRELFKMTTSEGVELNGWMVKPAGFDATRRYPVIMYQYSGPGSQQVLNQWGIGMNGQGALLEQYLAQQGYVVVCVDGRGTGGRGAAFEKCTYLRLGDLEAKDQVEAALWLGKQSYVDKSRIAIWGWSYGGFNTLMAMSEGRNVFCAGIAIAPPTNWRYYDSVYTERYMRTPKENKEGFDGVCPFARVEKLSGKLLLVHGLADDNVHYQNTAEYVEALVQADKDFRQLVYTNRNHSIYGANTRHHLFRQCVNFFNESMK